MAQNVQNPASLPIKGCDLFLLEQWDTSSPLQPDEQMIQVFDRFTQLPMAQRQVYAQQVQDRGVWSAGHLPLADQDILSQARLYNERNVRSAIWLRTYYGPGSEDALAAIMSSVSPPVVAGGGNVVFSDAALYDYGESWEHIFRRIPQLLEIARLGQNYEAEVAESLQICQEFEREDRAVVEENGGEWPEDASDLGQLYSQYHQAAQVGIIYVLDEETLGGPEEVVSERKVLAAWYDGYGRTVRWNRMTPHEVLDTWGIIASGGFDDNPVWTDAEIGDEYDRDGPLGPPYVLDEGNEGDEDTGEH
ncbi:hypothetical protein GQ53DRAFT_723921 [Thozetella sp. PMI_491]|nr:hypothetical protein GQ53DRAFT_723921 [Thozetella sp. PMI_491]